MIKQLQLFKLLKEQSIVLFKDSHNVHTAELVIDKILDNIDTNYDCFLVLYNIEFTLSLIYKYNVDPKNITFLSDHENKTDLAKRLNIKCFQMEEKIKMNKRPIMLINPPYTNGSQDASEIYTAIIDNCINKFNPIAIGGVTPENLMNGGQKKKTLRTKLNEKYNLKYLRFLSQQRDWNDKIKVDTVSWVYDENYKGDTSIVSRYSNTPYTVNTKLDEYVDGATQTIHDWLISIQTTNKIKLKAPKLNRNISQTDMQVKISKEFNDSYTLETGIKTESDNNEWRVVFGYMRCNTVAIVPPGASVPGKYRYMPFGQDEALARKFALYMLSEPVRFIMKLVYTSRTLDNPQLSYIPSLDLKKFNNIDNTVLYSQWKLDPTTQQVIKDIIGVEVPF
tara:strand:- start:126 stop:1304 length:1179 start_codon:yes stop_codon:yes gene_type:complete